MAIQWDSVIVEMSILGAIIYGSIYVDNLISRRTALKEKRESVEKITKFVAHDLGAKMRFIEESIQYKDFKPFFTDMWDAIILGGRQTLLAFETFQNLQHTYSWMKYYNNELEQRQKKDGNNSDDYLFEILDEIKGSINGSLTMLKKEQQHPPSYTTSKVK